ncbi:response regulator transcription factor [Acidaminobacter sp. JC074]|uniref:LytR/AlgR family response regulator transcription factor n=1 Tax=Acidaminobacter sp. JC074 TaxID=2530199 RepID=UPI001F0E2FB5|nr:LytTR family DNA-binding domain-containing protein [Acidaminobacter sp. JC074]MCH4890371.1 response regulator transcription factor [Acidaminobacter sp. JC074]
MKIKTITVDDNKEILTSLENHLKQIDYIDLLYSTMDSEDFLEVVLERKPDLVIMDIDMPRLDGIELGKILRQKLPYLEIVYVTSHGEYMREAFEVYASDFLEKPYDISRLKTTLERIAKKLNISEEVYEIKAQKNIRHIRVSEILCIEAFKRKSIIYTDQETIEADHAFNDLVQLFDSKYIYKSARSFAINLLKVESIQPFSRTSLEVTLRGSDIKPLLSKNNYDEFRDLIKEIG